MPRLRTATLGAVLASAIAAAAIAEPDRDQAEGRYTMSPADGGFVRLDRNSGAMSFCSRQSGSWTCEAMADGQQALRDEIERLQSENTRLEAAKKHLEEMLGLGSKPGEGVAPGAGAGTMKVPTEQDVDRMFDYIEGLVKKFKERIERLEEKPQDEQPL